MVEAHPLPTVHNFQDLAKDPPYGMLKAISFAGRDRRGKSLWLCLCECGREKVVLGDSLRSGNTKSCGCAKASMISARFTVHGASRRGRQSREFITWMSMLGRCCNQKNKGYRNYGGRGIKVCERWRNSFEAFLADMGPRPSPEHTIERVNNDGDYEPANCRWATWDEQAANRRNNHPLTLNGETHTIAEWTRRLGFHGRIIRDRLKQGWSVEKALTTPKHPRYRAK